MGKHAIIELLSNLELATCVALLVLMKFRRQVDQYKPLAFFLAARIANFAIYSILRASAGHMLSRGAAYKLYFYLYWTEYAVEAILGFIIIFSIYNLAMAPLKGLQRLGILMFRWAAGIAVAIAITMAFGPHITSTSFIQRSVTQLQQTQSVLTLCMLLFVCLAIRPMGLSYRSRIFGVSLGLGILATTDLVGAAWLTHFSTVNSIYNIVNGVAVCSTLVIWMGYFAVPEPKRRLIVLPTTSPFLRWNQISLALGDAPGFVAVGDVSPDMFAPAEVEIMRRASLKMTGSLAN